MKKHLIFLLLTISTLLLVSCDKNQANKEIQGYIKTRLLYIASSLSGTLQQLYVHRGELVKANQALFILDQQPQLATLKQAQANVVSAKATLANLKHGQRETVLAAIRAQIAQVLQQLCQGKSNN